MLFFVAPIGNLNSWREEIPKKKERKKTSPAFSSMIETGEYRCKYVGRVGTTLFKSQL